MRIAGHRGGICALAVLVIILGDAPAAGQDEIAFVRELDQRGIWLVDEGGRERRLTADVDYGPAWSPDGRWIAFQRFDGGGPDIYVMRADGTRVQALTTDGGFFGVAWSPDGERIAMGGFGGPHDGREEIFLMDADGSGLTRLTHGPWTTSRPTWSSDGSTIAFASRRDGNFDVYLMGADGADERRLTSSPARDVEPVWSPDGGRIAFISRRRGHSQDLYVIRPDGTGLRRLTTNGAQDWAPDWAPDGTRIAFTRYRPGQEHIVVLDLRTDERTRLATSPAFELQPAWRPR